MLVQETAPKEALEERRFYTTRMKPHKCIFSSVLGEAGYKETLSNRSDLSNFDRIYRKMH
jgi:hypothetical protein